MVTVKQVSKGIGRGLDLRFGLDIVGDISKPGDIGLGEKYLFAPVMRGGDPVRPSL
jgi:hypothetical protein